MKKLIYPEGATPLDPDEEEGLLLTHITTRGELDRWEQENIMRAMAWAERTTPIDILNERFMQTLHRRMFSSVWKWAGHYRQSDKNIGGSWHQVPMSIIDLCEDAKLWIRLQDESPDEMAVRFHHRLVAIHAFPNGNGRHARLMTDLLLENILHVPRFTWGSKSLLKNSQGRKEYIQALHAADGNRYQPLLKFVRT